MIFFHSVNFRERVCSAFRPLIAGCFALVLTTPVFAATAAADAPSPWVATWGTAMVAQAPGGSQDFSGKTLRQIVRTSVGGTQVRIWLSNQFGSEPLHVGAAHVALGTAGHVDMTSTDDPEPDPGQSGILAGSDRALTFHHSGSVVIPPGAVIVSDPIALNVPALANLTVSLYFPDHTLGTTEHSSSFQRVYAATGNLVGADHLEPAGAPHDTWYFLTGVDVYAPGGSAVVAFGDSITDGALSTSNANHRWPDYLAARLAADANTRKAGVLGVVNVGIGGNRVLLDGYGPNAVSRVNWDVLARSGAKYLIVLESINDIGRFTNDNQPYGDLAQRLEFGLAQLATQAHQHGILVFGATILPYQGCKYYSLDGEKVRGAVNQWIRSSNTFDGVVDFDKAIQDPQNPLHFAPQFDSGDHLHPKDAGYEAMGNAIDLTLFTKKR